MDSITFVSSCSDGTMRIWNVATGAHKEELDKGSFPRTALRQRVGKCSITFKDDLLLVSEEQSVVVSFRAPHVILAGLDQIS